MSNGTNNARDLEILSIRGMMASEEGRKFFMSILLNSGVEADTFDSDPLTHAYKAGRRAVGLLLRDELRSAAPASYFQMLKEANDE